MKRNNKLVSAMLTFVTAALLLSCEKDSARTTGEAAFAAWETGERIGDYTAFRKMLSPRFSVFSHPTHARGVFQSDQALQQMMSLIESRERVPNNLTFSDAVFFVADGEVAVQFNSQGTVMGSYPYKGYNTIIFSVSEGLVTGFREYFGDIDPAWFPGQEK